MRWIQAELKDNPLRVGLSVSADVDVSDQSGPRVADAPVTSVMRGDTGEDVGPEVDALVAKILADNGARPVSEAAHETPLKGAALAITAFALAMGTFTQVLDTTIANVSLPTIAGNLGASTDQSTWIITAFVVANGIGVPLTGWLMNRYGVVKVFVLSMLGFTVASLLCGIAWSLESLVFFRILQGALSGPIIPGSQALMLSIFPHNRRTTALAIWSITTLVAPICGPMLGGYISDSFHWGWIFLINVPVGLLVVALCWANLAARETPVRKLPIDLVGMGLLIVWAGALQVMLDNGKNDDWFASSWIVTLAIVSVIGFGAFLLWELTEEHPVVDLSLFKSRNFALGTVVFCLGNGVFIANMLLIPLWLQTQLGYTATWAGLVSAPTGVVAVLVTPLAARLMARFDARWVATIAFAASGVSYWMRASLTADASFMAIAIPLMVQGISSGLLLHRHHFHPAGRRAAVAHSRGVGPVEFRPHHRGGLFGLAGHHLLGPARGVSPEPHGRHDHRPMRRRSTMCCHRCTIWACRSWRPRRR